MKIYKRLFLFNLLLYGITCYSQVKITDNVNDNTLEDKNALLELESINNDKGLLMNAIPLESRYSQTPIGLGTPGILIYNNAYSINDTGLTPGYYVSYYGRWNKLIIKKNQLGDIKSSLSATNSDGWYLLDGRDVTTLPPNARLVAE